MVNPCPNGFCLTWHFHDIYDGNENATHPVCYRNRAIYDVGFRPNGTVFEFLTGKMAWGWESGYVGSVNLDGVYGTLLDYYKTIDYLAAVGDYFTIDHDTRSRCFSPSAPPPPPSLIFRGTASPPPPRRKMCGCDCNTIASIIAEHMAEKQRLLDAIKEHIDSRAIEQLKHINKMLQDIDMDLDLQDVINEIKRVEKNLWNGINGG